MPPAPSISAVTLRRLDRDRIVIAPVMVKSDQIMAEIRSESSSNHSNKTRPGGGGAVCRVVFAAFRRAAFAACRCVAETPLRRRIHEICHRHKGVSLRGAERDRRVGRQLDLPDRGGGHRDMPPGMPITPPFHLPPAPRNAAWLARCAPACQSQGGSDTGERGGRALRQGRGRLEIKTGRTGTDRQYRSVTTLLFVRQS